MGHKVDLLSMGNSRLPRRELVYGVHVIRVPSIRNSIHFCTIPEAASYMLSSTLMLQHSERRREMGQAAKMRMEEYFSWPAVCGKYLKLYDDALVEI